MEVLIYRDFALQCTEASATSRGHWDETNRRNVPARNDHFAARERVNDQL